tara:strand:- start:2659 stop:2859 length:201 start_codon:yes stop_codon:yes gene_type:complete
VQNPAYDHPIIVEPVDQQVPGASHDAGFRTRPIPAQPQVPGADVLAQLGSFKAARAVRLLGNIATR